VPSLIKGRPNNNNNTNNNKAKCIPGGTLRVLAGKNNVRNFLSVTWSDKNVKIAIDPVFARSLKILIGGQKVDKQGACVAICSICIDQKKCCQFFSFP
jgi:hypothetical protein